MRRLDEIKKDEGNRKGYGKKGGRRFWAFFFFPPYVSYNEKGPRCSALFFGFQGAEGNKGGVRDGPTLIHGWTDEDI